MTSEWLPSNTYQHAGMPDLEVYPEGDPNNPNYFSEIWIPVM
ncbi:GyrI-like domain-containing protein [Paenibacillus sp. SC116]|nr:GyrI-like domain-containing protein [Paenibacillus sp. SC116]